MPFITQGKTNLKYILIVIVLAVIVGGGILSYYYSWIKELDTRLAELELRLSGIKPPEEVTPTPSITKKQFDLAKIETLVSFYDSNNIKKKIILYDTWLKDQKNVIYLTDENLTRSSAVKIIDAVGSTVSIFVSPTSGKKYIAIGLLGPGDTQDLVVIDEEGKLITESLQSQNDELAGYLLGFEKWESPSSFWAKAVSYGQGPPSFQILVNATTGEIIERKPLSQ